MRGEALSVLEIEVGVDQKDVLDPERLPKDGGGKTVRAFSWYDGSRPETNVFGSLSIPLFYLWLDVPDSAIRLSNA